MTETTSTGPERPVLRVINGGVPSEEELAALVTVLSTRAAAATAEPAQPLRTPLSAWVTSGLVKGTRTKA